MILNVLSNTSFLCIRSNLMRICRYPYAFILEYPPPRTREDSFLLFNNQHSTLSSGHGSLPNSPSSDHRFGRNVLSYIIFSVILIFLSSSRKVLYNSSSHSNASALSAVSLSIRLGHASFFMLRRKPFRLSG